MTHISITPERAVDVVMAACAMHNYLRTKLPSYTNNLLDQEDEATHEIIPGAWRQQGNLRGLVPMRGNTSLAAAKRQRDAICNYINGVGAVAWQDRMI